jgi:murein DD-endopeptidase MepM/ murein hydrolase activator NlpD
VLIIITAAVAYGTLIHGRISSRAHAFDGPVTGLSMPAVGAAAPATDRSVLRPPAINRTLRAVQPVSLKQQETAAQLAALAASPTPQVQAQAQEDAVVRAAAVAPPPDLPPYQVYQVQEGDTVSSVAGRFAIDPQYIVWNNIEIHDPDSLSLGQSIIIPAGDGILHEVRYGETLSDIAVRYDVGVDAIVAFAANDITTPDDIIETQLVFVPGGRISAPPAPVAEPLPTDPAPDDGSVDEPVGDGGGSGVVSRPSSGAGLIWPVSGPISSYMGGGHPLGIDIDGFNLGGAGIAASTGGTVVFAGGNACCSYGLYVVVVSPEGIETLYAHLSSISVSQGQTVSQGEQLGIIGATGYSTGVHLHFEVIDNGVRVDPLSYLP